MNASARHAGTVAPIVALGGILIATTVDPTFSWTHDALSDLGIRDESAVIFNGTLVVGGGLGLLYAWGVWMAATTRVDRFIAGIFGSSCLALAGVGLFVIGHPFHLPAAIAFYVLFTVTMLADGLVRRRTETGVLVLGLVVVHVAIWVTWMNGLWPGAGLALPEYAGAVLVPMWVWFLGPEPTLLASQD